MGSWFIAGSFDSNGSRIADPCGRVKNNGVEDDGERSIGTAFFLWYNCGQHVNPSGLAKYLGGVREDAK
jgi:hypothetical protein